MTNVTEQTQRLNSQNLSNSIFLAEFELEMNFRGLLMIISSRLAWTLMQMGAAEVRVQSPRRRYLTLTSSQRPVLLFFPDSALRFSLLLEKSLLVYKNISPKCAELASCSV